MSEPRDRNGRTEAEAIDHFRAQNYPKPCLTADFVVFAREADATRVLLIRRGGHPCLGCWALPGGFADENETIEATAARELEEETHLTGLSCRLVNVYSRPGRDPRGWVVTAAFTACVPSRPDVRADDDAAEARWFPVVPGTDGFRVELPVGERLAFDHAQIIADAAALML